MAIELRTGEDFSVNGHMKGTLKLYRDDQFLGPAWTGDLGSRQFKKEVVKEIVEALEIFDSSNANETYAKMLLWSVSREAQNQAESAETSADGNSQRHGDSDALVINVGRVERLQQIELAWNSLKALNDPRPQYFRYGAQIADSDGGRPRVLNKHALTGVLLRSAKWVKGYDQATDPPEQVVDDMMHYSLPDLPELRGVKETPFCRPDGSIVIEPGYDDASGFMLKDHRLHIDVPDAPGPDDLAAARNLLFSQLLKDFPFVGAADKAHQIAVMLTPLVMPMIDGPIPLFMFTAPTPRSGKGKLATVASIIGTGFSPPPQAPPRNDESWRKIITAKLKAAVPVVNFDNISESQKLSSPALAALLTAPDRIWSDREMGTSRDLVLPNNTLWLATANNVNMHDEVVGRTVEIAIDPATERPELRRIENPENAPSLEAWTKRNRGRLLSAVLTFVRAWVREGRPRGQEVFGSFDIWAQVVGGILDVAGIPGFLKNRERFRERAAHEIDEIKPFIAVWLQVFGSRDISVKNILTMCSADDVDLLPSIRAGLRYEQAIERLSQFLRSIQERVFEVGGTRYRIMRGGKTDTRRPGWRLEAIQEP